MDGASSLMTPDEGPELIFIYDVDTLQLRAYEHTVPGKPPFNKYWLYDGFAGMEFTEEQWADMRELMRQYESDEKLLPTVTEKEPGMFKHLWHSWKRRKEI